MTLWIPVLVGALNILGAIFKTLPETDARWRDTKRLKKAMRKLAQAQRALGARATKLRRRAQANVQIWQMVVDRLKPIEEVS